MDKRVRRRINKLFAHAVNTKVEVFKDPDEIDAASQSVLRRCAQFVRDCRARGHATPTGNAPKYLRILRELAPDLNLPDLKDWGSSK